MKLDALRQLIREEMRTVIKEELKDILTEAVVIASAPEQKTQGVTQLNQPFKEVKSTIKPSFSQVMAERKTPTSTGNPLLDILNETAQAGEWKTLNGGEFNAADAVNWAGGMPGGVAQTVSSVEEMISKQSHVTDINDVRIDAVPDFTGLMNKMKENGSI